MLLSEYTQLRRGNQRRLAKMFNMPESTLNDLKKSGYHITRRTKNGKRYIEIYRREVACLLDETLSPKKVYKRMEKKK